MPCTLQDFNLEARGYNLPNTAGLFTGPGVGLNPVYSAANQGPVPSGGVPLIFIMIDVFAAQHGHPLDTSFNNFISNIWSQYSTSANPCNFLLNRYNNFNNQLTNNTYGLTQTLLKTAKRDYFAHMYNFCGCGTIPPIAPLPAQNPSNQGTPIIDIERRYNEDL
tara:strand:- start:99 stop:590 length:492 start_codon:yes stop_codon:yes gene_type:complete